MHKSIATILLTFCISTISAQYIQYKELSIEPVLKECTTSEVIHQEDVDCTYDKISEEVYAIIGNHDISFYSDKRSFKLEITWDKKGIIKKINVYDGRKKIKDEFSKNIKQYFKSLDFHPAKSLSGKKVKYTSALYIRKEKKMELDSIVKPMFPGCKGALLSTETMKKCSDTDLLEYIYKQLKYPSKARNNGTQGTVVIEFVVNTDGLLENMFIKKDPGDGCGEAALNIIRKMNEDGIRWIPGKVNGVTSPLPYSVPVKFKLAGR